LTILDAWVDRMEMSIVRRGRGATIALDCHTDPDEPIRTSAGHARSTRREPRRMAGRHRHRTHAARLAGLRVEVRPTARRSRGGGAGAFLSSRPDAPACISS